MSRINENRFLQSIRLGHFSYKRKPHLIKLYKLDEALKKVSKSKIAKEVAYCLCTYPSERLSAEKYFIAFNAIAIKNWDEIAVVKTSSKIKSFSDIVCIDYSLINNLGFREENDLFFNLLLHEVKLLTR